MSSSGLPELRVEAKDDQHSIIHLLAHHGIQLDKGRGPVVIRPSAKELDSSEGSVQQLLLGMEQAIRLSINRPIGFVMDADEVPESR